MRQRLLVLLMLTSVVVTSQPILIGTSTNGAANCFGGVFSITAGDSNYTYDYSFPGIPLYGAYYNSLCTANGKLYGLAINGGNCGGGVLFEFDTATSSFINKFNFCGVTGSYPRSSLMLASNGKMYGLTSMGGANSHGAIFEYDPLTDVYTKKFDFNSLSGYSAFGGLTESANGKLYGLTSAGGTLGRGVLFEFDPATSAYSVKFNFDGALNGENPYGSLTMAANGHLYGMTRAGGSSNLGVIFEYNDTLNTLTKHFDFSTAVSSGREPEGSMISASNGKLYGLTLKGGASNFGCVFEFNPSTNTFLLKSSFGAGALPYGSLFEAANGKLYGMTSSGGSAGDGTLFEFDISIGFPVTKVNFNGLNGGSPKGSLMQVGSGKLYGLTSYGGKHDFGTLFSYHIATNTHTKILDFGQGDQGSTPMGFLTQASNGKCYGTTHYGGNSNEGVLFEYDPVTHLYSKKYDFTGLLDGGWPQSVTQAPNGKLYGIAKTGGIDYRGVLFEFDPVTSVYTKKHDFGILTDGKDPVGKLLLASNAKMYGLTNQGGGSNQGVLYEFDPFTSVYTVLYDFGIAGSPSAQPHGSLMQASNGKLYAYGSMSIGDLFEFDLSTNTLSVVFDFVTALGESPAGQPIQASNGKLYGLADHGGAHDKGTIFEYDFSTASATTLFDFDSINGQYPQSSFIESSNGKLYTLVRAGGMYNAGVVIEFDYTSNTVNKILDLTLAKGNGAVGELLELKSTGVWPGDADHDYDADNNDLLPIGLHFGSTGAPRTITGNLWAEHSATNWGAVQNNGSDLKHADSNGDGVINLNDTLAVNLNFSMVHLVDPWQTEQKTSSPEIYFVPASSSYGPGDMATIELWVGTSTVPATLYGLAFNINYDASMVVPGSEQIAYSPGWIGIPGTNAISFSKPVPVLNTLFGAIVRTNHTNANGYGRIATISFQVENTFPVSDTIQLSVAWMNVIDSAGTTITLNPVAGSLPVSVGLAEQEPEGHVLISPNPGDGYFTFSNLSPDSQIVIYDINGRVVYQKAGTNKMEVVDLRNHADGMYFYQLVKGQQRYTGKLVVR